MNDSTWIWIIEGIALYMWWQGQSAQPTGDSATAYTANLQSQHPDWNATQTAMEAQMEMQEIAFGRSTARPSGMGEWGPGFIR